MRRSIIPITYHPKDGVNLEPGTSVIFIAGPNAHGLDPKGEYLGVYQEYRVMETATHLRIVRQGKRFSPVISQVFRIYDARDAEIERLRTELRDLKAYVQHEFPEFQPTIWSADDYRRELELASEQEGRSQMYGGWVQKERD